MSSTILVKRATLDPEAQPEPLLLIDSGSGAGQPIDRFCRHYGVEPIDVLRVDSGKYVIIFRRAG